MIWIAEQQDRWLCLLVAGLILALMAGKSYGSTYVAYIPLDSSIYTELDTLDSLGYLDTYFREIRPICRVEAARLTLEAEANLTIADQPDPLARSILRVLNEQLQEEIGWVRNNHEDNLPTMIHPLERAEAQYVYSTGPRRYWESGPNGPLNAQEQTPLLPNNDGIPTDSGSNEILRLYGWGGFGGFLTGYAEGAIAGPLTHESTNTSRGQLLDAEAVLSLGNAAISFGQHEQWWGTSHYAALSQGNNAKPFWGLTTENVHPTYLPWILRYLGPGRRELIFGQLDADRAQSQHPWIVGHILVFKPLPVFEFGLTRTIIFGGRDNNNYTWAGFAGRFSGIATGNPANGQTKSRGGLFVKFRPPKMRNLELYQELVGSDNMTAEMPHIGHYVPFLSVAYQGGFYLPRLTADGLTDLRLEYALTPGAYSVQNGNSLYYTYENQLFGDPVGPNATQVDLQIGRWFGLHYKTDLDFFYTEEAPGLSEGPARFFFPPNSTFYPYPSFSKEHSFGLALGLFCLPTPARNLNPKLAAWRALVGEHAKVAIEYADSLNYQPHAHSIRAMVMLSATLDNVLSGWVWR